MVYVEHKFGSNKRAIKTLLFQRCRAAIHIRNAENRIKLLQKKIVDIDETILFLTPGGLETSVVREAVPSVSEALES